ncbi:MAG: pirin family protein [Pseudomonadota bacterium]
MSWNPDTNGQYPLGDEADAIETVIVPRARDLGGFEVRRALPSAKRQMVGPFIFFDQMGPAEFLPTRGMDVRPHPHIGLATISYLHRGRMHHRDSLGTDQWIEPGAVNWMVAGNGITHSERTDDQTQTDPMPFFGIQTWVALPDSAEETAPTFEHVPERQLPMIEDSGASVRLILGNAYGDRAPVKTFSEMFYGDAVLTAGAQLPMPDNHEDRAVYVIEGTVEVAGDRFEPGHMMVFRPGDAISIKAVRDARLMILGGETMGTRYIWWNFVASSQEKIDAAKEAWKEGDWEHGRFQLPPNDNQEFIPLD